MSSGDKIDLAELERGFAGRPYSALIQHHIRSQEQPVRLAALVGHKEAIPPALSSGMEALIDRWNLRAYNAEFWREDCGNILREVLGEAREVFSAQAISPTDEQLFDVFNMLTLNFAASAATQPKMRTLMGISGPRLLSLSGMALLYPLAATAFVLTGGGNAGVAIGYGLANLGYVLLVAALVSGTFQVFKFSKRWQVFLAAVVAWMLGTVLSNLPG